MARYKIFVKVTTIPRSAGLKGFGTLQQYRTYEHKTYPSRSQAELALKKYDKEKGHRSFNRAAGAKYKIRSVVLKKRQPNIFGGF